MAGVPISVELGRRVGYELKRVQAASRAALQVALRPSGLTLSQYACLEVLDQRPGLSHAELARATLVSRQSMSILLRTMRAAGLVAYGSAGARGLRVTLTADGRARLLRARRPVLAVEELMVADFTVAEADRLLADLDRIARALGGTRG